MNKIYSFERTKIKRYPYIEYCLYTETGKRLSPYHGDTRIMSIVSKPRA